MSILNSKDLLRATFLLYSEKVRKLTEKTYKQEWFENKMLRGKGYHLDHRISIKECFDNDVSEDIASHRCNLELVPEGYNLSKGSRSSITLNELLTEVVDNEDYFG